MREIERQSVREVRLNEPKKGRKKRECNRKNEVKTKTKMRI